MGEIKSFLVTYCIKGVSSLNDAVIKFEQEVDSKTLPSLLKSEIAKIEGEKSVFYISPNAIILINYWEIN
jgi:hypothetical protein